MPLQELKMSLLAALLARNRLERLDIPVDQFRERRRTVPLASQRGGLFERDFAMSCPTQRRRAMRKGAALLMQYGRAAPNANNRRIARGPVRLFPCFDCWHDQFRGDKPFLSPLCPLSNR